ncbi:unnamed protein product [marine sediment metagenome]|uniref:Uncharacterized protein n=1 Tax=marine sediment metagenome TaxID=412755 RepID=X1F0M7_9ZZZZ
MKMKCPNCEYEYEHKRIDGERKTLKGKHEFIPLEFSNGITTFISLKYDNEQVLTIYICPECGNLIY